MSLQIQQALEGALIDAIEQNKIDGITLNELHKEGIVYDNYPQNFIQCQLLPNRSTLANSCGMQSHSGIFQINSVCQAGDRAYLVKAYEIADKIKEQVFPVLNTFQVDGGTLQIISFSQGQVLNAGSEQYIPCSIEYKLIR